MTSTPSHGAGDARPLAWPGDPEQISAADIDFEALAHVLANTCRRGGRMRHYHSLAAHAVVVSEEIGALQGLTADDRRTLSLHALIAGAAAAWLRDLPAGPARGPDRTGKLAAAIERALREAAGLDPVLGEEHAELLRFVDRMVAAAESRDLLDGAETSGGAVAFPPCRPPRPPTGTGAGGAGVDRAAPGPARDGRGRARQRWDRCRAGLTAGRSRQASRPWTCRLSLPRCCWRPPSRRRSRWPWCASPSRTRHGSRAWRLGELTARFALDVSSEGGSEEVAAAAARRWGSALERALHAVAERHDAVLLPARAVAAGALDLTPEVEAALARALAQPAADTPAAPEGTRP